MMELVEEVCCVCGVTFGLTEGFSRNAQHHRINFYCPNGHEQHFLATSYEQLEKDHKLLNKNYNRYCQEQDRRAERVIRKYRELTKRIPKAI